MYNDQFSASYKQKKIEKDYNQCLDNNNINTTMKPTYSINEILNCAVIVFNNRTYLVDHSDRDRIINFCKKFVFTDNEPEDYPSYIYNYRRMTYLDFIFNFNNETSYYIFKNDNKFDLRRCNVEVYHKYHKIISEKYNIIEYIPGHHSTMGQDANIMKNPIWRINEHGKEYLVMYCEKDTICKLCDKSYQKILDFENTNNKKLTWFKASNGYIHAHTRCEFALLYIHQVITGCNGNGKGTSKVSVDHIDQDPFNNTFENLRIATRKEQEENSKGIKSGTKRERKHSAQDLPEGITQDMMKKYVVYYHEWLDKEHTREREFFKVEKHPKFDKPWATTKSNKISIQEKLAQANKVVDDLENNIYPEKNEPSLPKYVSLVTARGKPHLVFEKRMDDGRRLNVKMVLQETYDLQEQLEILWQRISVKYPEIKPE